MATMKYCPRCHFGCAAADLECFRCGYAFRFKMGSSPVDDTFEEYWDQPDAPAAPKAVMRPVTAFAATKDKRTAWKAAAIGLALLLVGNLSSRLSFRHDETETEPRRNIERQRPTAREDFKDNNDWERPTAPPVVYHYGNAGLPGMPPGIPSAPAAQQWQGFNSSRTSPQQYYPPRQQYYAPQQQYTSVSTEGVGGTESPPVLQWHPNPATARVVERTVTPAGFGGGGFGGIAGSGLNPPTVTRVEGGIQERSH